jgi:hypothetical protein
MIYKHIIKDSVTGEVVENNFSNKEILEYELENEKFLQEQANKQSALNKLKTFKQLEEIYDNGIDSWKARIAQIKLDNPKETE